MKAGITKFKKISSGLARRPAAKILCGLVVIPVLLRANPFTPGLLDDIDFSRAVFDRKGTLLHLSLSRDEKYRLYVPLRDISPVLQRAVLLQEDRWFYRHPGVNPVSLVRAFWTTYVRKGERMQQTARVLVFNEPSHVVAAFAKKGPVSDAMP